MRNVKLTIAYDGTCYKGWQIQKNEDTIQAEIQRAILKVMGSKHTVQGAGRTDSGVHALGQVANFKAPMFFPVEKIPRALNDVLPRDIVIKKAEEVSSCFHARFDSRRKTYTYRIMNSQTPDPFTDRYSWRVEYVLDKEIMAREAQMLSGCHDFKCFQASDKRERSSVRTIHELTLKRKGLLLTVDVVGDGFLYNMVRNITGTLVDIGRGYLPSESMRRILLSKDRTKAGPTAPARGLFLVKVDY